MTPNGPRGARQTTPSGREREEPPRTQMMRARSFHEDRRGAVMIMGLGMSCFLIGSLWFLIGIGDAIVFRDTMQEAADHSAFTSAALHAKGMNFVSACNILMLVAMVIYIVFGLIHDVLLAVCIIGGTFTFGTACAPWTSFRHVYANYARVMKIFSDVVHYMELGAAYGYPYLAAWKGYSLGRDYGDFSSGNKRSLHVVPFSLSMIPGAISGPVTNFISNRVDMSRPDWEADAKARKALPVQGLQYKYVCKKIGKMGFDFLLAFTEKHVGGQVLGLVKKMIGGSIQGRYCNPMGSGTANLEEQAKEQTRGEEIAGGLYDQMTEANKAITERDNPQRLITGQGMLDEVDLNKSVGGGGFNIGSVQIGSKGGSFDPGFDSWWGREGPLVPWRGTYNGSIWNQVWSLNLSPDFKDESEHRVAIAARQLGVEQTANSSVYMAQAEFYFDCGNIWIDEACNGNPQVDANAGYAIKWRARLRRVNLVSVGGVLGTFGGGMLSSLTNQVSLSQFTDKKLDSLKKKGDTFIGKDVETPSTLTGSIGKLLNDEMGKGSELDDLYNRGRRRMNGPGGTGVVNNAETGMLGRGATGVDDALGLPTSYH